MRSNYKWRHGDLAPDRSLLLQKKDVWAHLSHIKRNLSFLSFFQPRAVAVYSPHEAKLFSIMLVFFLFQCTTQPLYVLIIMNHWSTSVVHMSIEENLWSYRHVYLDKVLAWTWFPSTDIKPSTYYNVFSLLYWVETGLGQFPASCICMSHQHNLLAPGERSFHLFV